MSVDERRPWLSLYANPDVTDIEPDHATMLDAFETTLARCPDKTALIYFDGRLTFRDLDERSDALAAYLQQQGFEKGDRLAIYTQNNPAYVIGDLAAWKCGGTVVNVSPMNKSEELTFLLADSGAVALLCLDDLWTSVARPVISTGGTSVRTAVVASALDEQTRGDARVLPDAVNDDVEGAVRLTDIQRDFAGRRPTPVPLGPDDAAFLTYTSGTTGKPKGAINAQRNVVFSTQAYCEWNGWTENDCILGISPLFHITGAVAHVALCLMTGATLILMHRMNVQVTLEAMREHRPTHTGGAVTAFIALTTADGATKDDWSSFRSIGSGGAPIAPATVEKIRERTGLYLRNVYGMTETTSPAHAVPPDREAPVDPDTGALSVGVPVFNTFVRVLDEAGHDVPPGTIGEFAIRGPQVVPGYWGNPQATSENLPGGEMRTGDVGFMSPDGWFFLVDRKKDMINASGFKVWPREVEDLLYGHPAICEVAVVGVPDEYRGETVKAVVTLNPGTQATPEEIIAWAKERVAAYKYPRVVEIVSELPKTASGKILRRELKG